MTKCLLCDQLYTDPRSLPCLHTFCLQCLQKRNLTFTHSGATCPVCGRKYAGPLDDLPSNSFVQKLMKIDRMAADAMSKQIPCEVCKSDVPPGSGAEPPAVVMATHYCLNCTESLCDKCCAMHGRIKSSRNHQVVQLGTQLTAVDLRGPVGQCDQHLDEPLKMFCCDCSRCICFLCYAEYHTGHRCQVGLCYATDLRKMMGRVCLSVLDLTRERKGLRSPKLAEWKPITWVSHRFRGQKVEVNRPLNAVTDNAPYAGRGITIFSKISLLFLPSLRPGLQ